ncbi:MAG: hypothetical protein WA759_11565, partial [Pseudolabrys sp.]
ANSGRTKVGPYRFVGTGKLRISTATFGYSVVNTSTLPSSTSAGSTPGHSVEAPRNQRRSPITRAV